MAIGRNAGMASSTYVPSHAQPGPWSRGHLRLPITSRSSRYGSRRHPQHRDSVGSAISGPSQCAPGRPDRV
jgi:hypothetical protein